MTVSAASEIQPCTTEGNKRINAAFVVRHLEDEINTNLLLSRSCRLLTHRDRSAWAGRAGAAFSTFNPASFYDVFLRNINTAMLGFLD
ncbi:hypothetical protein BaRGS_00031953 [Batillaria attramentaria]|uniref:Uncharacterized protein n=1 Tax=Batillaria attramentaria TaxID=370345 RepID=A0ABD0JQL6_9CAEN